MDQPQRKLTGVPLEITIKGEEATVARLLVAMAAALGGDIAAVVPPLLLTREQAARRTGWGLNRFTELVRVGKLTNHGSGRKLLISLKELEEYIRDSG